MIENFSHGYWLVDADVVPFEGGEVTVSHDLGAEFLEYSQYPLLKIGNQHYRVKTEAMVPPDVVAVPDSQVPEEEYPPLLAKDQTVHCVMETGVE